MIRAGHVVKQFQQLINGYIRNFSWTTPVMRGDDGIVKDGLE